MLNAVHSLQVSALNPVTVSEVLPGCGAPDNFVFFSLAPIISLSCWVISSAVFFVEHNMHKENKEEKIWK